MEDSIGFIGLGLMGAAMAKNILASGRSVVVHDLSPQAVTTLVESHGALAAASPKEVADRCRIVIACLPSPQASLAVAQGENGVIHGSAIRYYIEASTIGIQTCRTIAQAMETRNIHLIDAPISGGPKGAAAGTLSSMVACPPFVWNTVSQVVASYCGKTFFVGETAGLAQACKLVNNAMSLTALALACETTVLGVAAGLDAHTMIDVINASSGRSTVTTDKFPASVLPRTFDYGASINTAAKDLELFLTEAKALGMRTDGTRAVAKLWQEAVADGQGEMDFTSLIQRFEQPLGIEVGSKNPLET